MPLLVQKYGGTSLGSLGLLEQAADRIARTVSDGNRVAVVLSAMGNETDRLVALADDLSQAPVARELDVLLATGEQVSVSLMAIALAERGIEAVSYLGWQVPIETDAASGRARIVSVARERLMSDLDTGRVPVIAGFQGVDPTGNVTTLGRGGSDTTAVAVAAVLDADECQILTDVHGVYTTDPALVPEARLLAHVTFEEIQELAALGSRVVQTRAVEFAGKFRVPVRVMHAHSTDPGTLISYEETNVEAPVVSGIAFNRNEAEVTVTDVPDEPGMAHRILRPVSDAGIEIDMIVLNAPRDGRVDFSFTVHRKNHDRAMALAREAVADIDGCAVSGSARVAKISVVGVGLRSHAGVATTLFEALAADGINVRMVATSEIKISVLVDERYLELGVRSLHEAYGLGDPDK